MQTWHVHVTLRRQLEWVAKPQQSVGVQIGDRHTFV